MAESNRIKLVIEFDGTDFAGWQIQPGQRTVQGDLENALATIFRQHVKVYGAGRTDAGVHADGMTAHFDLPDDMELNQIIRSINGLTSNDIAIVSADWVSDDFHARFSAKSRTYRYRVVERSAPLLRSYSWLIHWKLDRTKLDEAAEYIIGERDFTPFKIHSGTPGEVCNVSGSRWDFSKDILEYFITANRFVHGMVRLLVGVQVAYARDVISWEEFTNAFDEELDRNRAFKAPPQGLCLVTVEY